MARQAFFFGKARWRDVVTRRLLIPETHTTSSTDPLIFIDLRSDGSNYRKSSPDVQLHDGLPADGPLQDPFPPSVAIRTRPP